MSRNFTQEATTLLALQPQTPKETGDRLEAIGRLLGETCQAITDTRKLLAKLVEAGEPFHVWDRITSKQHHHFRAALDAAKEAL